MSRIERYFCGSALWGLSSGASADTILPDVRGPRVLEIGAGNGAIAERLVLANPELVVTATDVDPRMTAAATARLRRFPTASAATADATALPFPDESFDTVTSCLMLHHIVEWRSAIAEIVRVLRPGGHFVGYDLLRTPLNSLIHRIDGSPHRLVSPQEFAAACRDQDLAVDVRTRLFGHLMRFVATRAE